MRIAIVLALVAGIVGTACGSSGSGAGPGSQTDVLAPGQRAACQSLYGDVLLQMRSLMAQVDAGMTVGSFDEEYPKLAGPLQLAKDASKGSACQAIIREGVNNLYVTIKSDANDPSTIALWNQLYEAVQAQIAALP